MISKKRNILVVDDDNHFAKALKQSLNASGINVSVASDGIEALSMLKKDTYDLVLADLNMPKMDGLELTVTIRRYFPSVQVVIITAYPSTETEEQAKLLTVSAYLTKPVKLQEVNTLVNRLITEKQKKLSTPHKTH